MNMQIFTIIQAMKDYNYIFNTMYNKFKIY